MDATAMTDAMPFIGTLLRKKDALRQSSHHLSVLYSLWKRGRTSHPRPYLKVWRIAALQFCRAERWSRSDQWNHEN